MKKAMKAMKANKNAMKRPAKAMKTTMKAMTATKEVKKVMKAIKKVMKTMKAQPLVIGQTACDRKHFYQAMLDEMRTFSDNPSLARVLEVLASREQLVHIR